MLKASSKTILTMCVSMLLAHLVSEVAVHSVMISLGQTVQGEHGSRPVSLNSVAFLHFPQT